jgi:hypothetical protein|tara:strand:- start:298 stop:1722 length:1425 start_codon:yes stop_codon:yes gene_type:complete
MPLNSYFLQGSNSEQRLVQDLINEQLKIYGQDVLYLPRKIINKDSILNETIASEFDDSFRLEAYLSNYEGFQGGGDILSKFGVQSTDQVTFIISKERYEDFISPFLAGENVSLTSRPQEGDLIYFPLDNTLFEIKYVEAKKPFYQLNKLYVYQLSCEVFDAALDENIDTGIEVVDQAASDFIYTTKLTMVGLGATAAAATAVVAKTLSTLQTGQSISSIDLINDGTGYTTRPLIGISTAPSRGINATAVAVMTNIPGQLEQSIERIDIVNPGFGYTAPPTVTIRSQNQYGTGAAATAIISSGSLSPFTITNAGVGYGSTPSVTVGAPADPNGTRATAVAVLNTVGVVTAINYTNAGIGYTLQPNVTISAPATGINTDNYLYGELVRGVSTGTTAHVANWDSDTGILQVTNTSSNFALDEIVVGIGTTQNGSDAARKIKTISDQDEYDEYADNIEVENAADEILDFSERNPFGEF